MSSVKPSRSDCPVCLGEGHVGDADRILTPCGCCGSYSGYVVCPMCDNDGERDPDLNDKRLAFGF